MQGSAKGEIKTNVFQEIINYSPVMDSSPNHTELHLHH